jgi:hypothetical protein
MCSVQERKVNLLGWDNGSHKAGMLPIFDLLPSLLKVHIHSWEELEQHSQLHLQTKKKKSHICPRKDLTTLNSTLYMQYIHNLQPWYVWSTSVKNISYKIEKSPFSQLRKNQSKVNTSSTSHREFHRRKDKTGNKGPRNKNQLRTKHKIKHESSMNNSARLTPVQGPSTVACMTVTSLSQLPHWLHQLPRMG